MIVLIERPARWTPRSELDMPRFGVVVEVVAGPISDPLTFVRHYNAASLDAVGATWAALCAAAARPGTAMAIPTAQRQGREAVRDGASKAARGYLARGGLRRRAREASTLR